MRDTNLKNCKGRGGGKKAALKCAGLYQDGGGDYGLYMDGVCLFVCLFVCLRVADCASCCADVID